MSDRDLVQELKSTITDLTQDRDDALAKVKSKEARLKQVMIKLEHATQDVKATGHRIAERDKELADVRAKLETKERLLEEALNKLKDIHDDSTEKTDSKETPEEEETEE